MAAQEDSLLRVSPITAAADRSESTTLLVAKVSLVGPHRGPTIIFRAWSLAAQLSGTDTSTATDVFRHSDWPGRPVTMGREPDSVTQCVTVTARVKVLVNLVTVTVSLS